MKLQEHLITSASGMISRKIWVSHPSNLEVKRIALFLDGDIYLDKIQAPDLLDDLFLQGILFVFVSSLDAETRHFDFTCNTDYLEYIVADVMSWVRLQFPQTNANGHLIAGVSLSGLAAGYITLRKPSIFGYALCQSGSFWWNNGWLINEIPRMPGGKSRFWISVGTEETQSNVVHPPTGLRQNLSQVIACEKVAGALSQSGHLVRYNVFNGGHHCIRWKEEFSRAISWLLNETEP